MASLTANRIVYEPLRTLAAASITGTYAAVGAGFSNPCRMQKIANTTDRDILVSYNGIDDHDIIPVGSAQILDFGTNKSRASDVSEQPQGTLVYVKTATTNPTTGSIYVTVIYLSEG